MAKKTKRRPLPDTIKRDLLVSGVIFGLWTFVLETYLPDSWSRAFPLFFELMTAFSPFIAAALVAYELVFRHIENRWSRIGYSVILAIMLFLLSLTIGYWTQAVPAGIADSLAWGNLVVTIAMVLLYLLAAGILLAFIHAVRPARAHKLKKA